VNFTNTSTGSPTAYTWDFGDGSNVVNGTYVPFTDTNPSHTFTAAGSYTVTLYAGNGNGTGTASQTVVVGSPGGGGGGGACTPDDATLCLSASRFKVTATFQKPNAAVQNAHAVTLTANTGYFWFLDPTNVEVVTKVLPFCADPFNSIWVFAAGLTNLAVDIKYVDTKANVTIDKINPQGTAFIAVQDTSAFKTCP
jgi:PKD repeat protein